jgi:hypothetical protein
MVEVNPIEVTFWLRTPSEKEFRKHTLYAPFRHVGHIPPILFKSVLIGSNVALYGSILKNVDGVNVQDYLHLRGGSYTFEQPIQFMSIHADKLS